MTRESGRFKMSRIKLLQNLQSPVYLPFDQALANITSTACACSIFSFRNQHSDGHIATGCQQEPGDSISCVSKQSLLRIIMPLTCVRLISACFKCCLKGIEYFYVYVTHAAKALQVGSPVRILTKLRQLMLHFIHEFAIYS